MKKLISVLVMLAVAVTAVTCYNFVGDSVHKDDGPSRLPKIDQVGIPPTLSPVQLDDSDSDSGAVLTTSLDELQEYLLDLINADRQAHSLPRVTLGRNTAAQRHAEEMLEHSYLAHWGMDGLKPYMRYTLTGGVNYEAENVSGITAPLEEGRLYQEQSPHESITGSQKGFMASPGHRANVLNPWHKKVNLGIACNQYTCAVVQQFEGSYIAFSHTPTLTAGRLTMEGTISEPFTVSVLQVWYDELPHPLSLGQLDATHMYRLGQRPAAFIREPAPPGNFYPDSATSFSWKAGIDPYELAPAIARGGGRIDNLSPKVADVPLITAEVWEISDNIFKIEADIILAIDELGPGVYTVVVWGKAGDELVPLTNYAIFVNGV